LPCQLSRRCAWCCRWWRWTWAHSFAQPHAAGPHHSPWTHHGARARHSARSHMVRGSAEVAAITLRRPAQQEAGVEDHRDNENDACDDAYPRQGLAEPTGPLIVTGLFSAGCRFSAGLWCLGHVRHDAACKHPAVETIGPIAGLLAPRRPRWSLPTLAMATPTAATCLILSGHLFNPGGHDHACLFVWERH
jgi:hypothetical protein